MCLEKAVTAYRVRRLHTCLAGQPVPGIAGGLILDLLDQVMPVGLGGFGELLPQRALASASRQDNVSRQACPSSGMSS